MFLKHILKDKLLNLRDSRGISGGAIDWSQHPHPLVWGRGGVDRGRGGREWSREDEALPTPIASRGQHRNSRQERHPGQLDEQCCPCSKGGTTFIKIKDWIRRFNRLKLMLKALRKSTLKQRGSREGAIPVTKRSFKSQVRLKRRSGNLSKIMREEEDLLRQDRQELYQLSTDKDKEPEETSRTSSLVRNEAVSLQIVPSTDNQP